MRRSAIALSLLLAGCACEQRTQSDSTSEFECCDTNWDTDLDWLDQDNHDTNSDPEALDSDGEDISIDSSEDEIIDPIPADCQELDQEPEELETLILTPLPPSGRTPMDCGPGCRQVTFAADSLYSHSYEVWSSELAFTTQMRTSTSFRSTEYLVQLDTLTHYKIVEQQWDWATSATKPRGGFLAFHDNTLVNFRAELLDSDTDSSAIIVMDGVTMLVLDAKQVLKDDFEIGGGYSRIDLFGNHVVYSELRQPGGVPSVLLLDMNTSSLCTISIPGYSANEPKIWGDKVVFHQSGLELYGGFQIFLYDITTATTHQLTNEPWDRFGPVIWEDRVAWTDCRNGCTILDELVSDVYMMDLTTGEETPVCTDPAAQPGPLTIWGDRIAWMDCRNDPEYPDYCGSAYGTRMDIYVYDITTGTEWLATDFPGMKMNPFLYEDRLYFVMLDNDGVYSIFEMLLP